MIRSKGCTPDNSFSDAFLIPNVLRGVVVNVTWAQLQPTSPENFDTMAIDQALRNIETYNKKYSEHPLAAILRIENAQASPDWVKELDGGPISTNLANHPITFPLFWTDAYRNAWRSLQKRLAEKYDRNQLIRQISNTSCAHLSDEPYVSPRDSATIIAMFKLGYTNQKYVDCLLNSIHDYDSWPSTRVDFTQNPFENLSVDKATQRGVYGPLDTGQTVRILRAFRTALGQRAIISNHNLAYPPFRANVELYQVLKEFGKPVEFQTASPGVDFVDRPPTGLMKDWDGAVKLGAELGATAIEVWPSVTFKGEPINDGWNQIECKAEVPPSECSGRSADDLAKWNRELEVSASH